MASMKTLALPVLEELFDNGPGFRMELWGRCSHVEWPEFKRILSMLQAQGMVEDLPNGDLVPLVDLTEEGHELIASLRAFDNHAVV